METISKANYLESEPKENTVDYFDDVLLIKAQKLGFINRDTIYYLKNLYVKYYSTVLFIFNKDKVIKIDQDKDDIEIKVANREDIKGIKCILNHKGNYKLFFKLDNHEECLDAGNDTTEEHISEYNLIIQDVVKELAWK